MIKFIKFYQFIGSLWNKRYMNSAERYARQENIAKLCCVIAGLGLGLVFFLMCFWSV